MIKAIIFDMDGTVTDSTRQDYTAWQHVFKEHASDFSFYEYTGVLGAKGSEIIEEQLDLDKEEVEQMLTNKERYFKKEIEKFGLPLLPYVEELLKEIKSMSLKTALTTGSGNKKLQMIFKRYR